MLSKLGSTRRVSLNDVVGRCAHCRRRTSDFAGGYSKVGPHPLCHPNVPNRPNCYKLVTLYGHSMPCAKVVCYEDHEDLMEYVNGD